MSKRVIRLLEREEEGKGASSRRRASFIPHESGSQPVHVPCLMWRPWFPDTGLPFDFLLLYLLS